MSHKQPMVSAILHDDVNLVFEEGSAQKNDGFTINSIEGTRMNTECLLLNKECDNDLIEPMYNDMFTKDDIPLATEDSNQIHINDIGMDGLNLHPPYTDA